MADQVQPTTPAAPVPAAVHASVLADLANAKADVESWYSYAVGLETKVAAMFTTKQTFTAFCVGAACGFILKLVF